MQAADTKSPLLSIPGNIAFCVSSIGISAWQGRNIKQCGAVPVIVTARPLHGRGAMGNLVPLAEGEAAPSGLPAVHGVAHRLRPADFAKLTNMEHEVCTSMTHAVGCGGRRNIKPACFAAGAFHCSLHLYNDQLTRCHAVLVCESGTSSSLAQKLARSQQPGYEEHSADSRIRK